MNIYENYFLKNRNSYTSLESKNEQNFRGNITKPIKTFQLGAQELSQVSAITKNYQQLTMMYKAAGSYIVSLFQKAAAFLLPVGALGLLFKNAVSSDDVQNVKLEREDGLNKSDELITFTLNDKNIGDAAKIVVSNDGNAEILVDDELNDETVNKYVSLIEENQGKFLEEVFDKTENAMQTVENVLDTESDDDFDLNSKSDVSRMATQFVDEKKRLSLMYDLVNPVAFFKNFKFPKGMPRNLEEGELPKEKISFKFSNLENRYFDGMQITVEDNKRGIKQGYVATYDGLILSGKEHKFNDKDDKFVPRIDWRIRNLTPMLKQEIKAHPELKKMFEYGYSLFDRGYKYYLKILMQLNKTYAQMYDGAGTAEKDHINRIQRNKMQTIEEFTTRIEEETAEKLAKRKAIGDQPLAEDCARVMRVYNVSAEQFDLIKKFAAYYDRITDVYVVKTPYLRDKLTQNAGLIRRKDINGVIIKDLFTNDELMLGVTRFVYKEEGEEVLSFGIFDKNLDELARIKFTKGGKVKFIAKPTVDLSYVDKMEQFLKNETKNGLVDKLTQKLEEIVYYHENMTAVDEYMAKSCKPLTVSEAINELKNPISYYAFSGYQIKKLYDNLESIRTISRKHETAVDRWQKTFFPDIEQTAKHLYGKIKKFGINYEYTFINNERVSGLRIITKDKKGKMTNVYFIDFEGNTYKLIRLPQNNSYKRLSYTDANLARLDEAAVKAEHLDLIFKKLYRTADIYNDVLVECANKMAAGRYKFLTKDIEEIISKYKYPGLFKDKEATKGPAKDYAHNNEITRPKKKRGVGAVGKKASTSAVDKEKPVSQRKNKNVNIRPSRTSFKTYTLTPELKERYADMLKLNGEFKSLKDISLEDVVEQLNRIFKLPYTERSPHLIHESINSGRIFEGRFSSVAPDGAVVTVSRVKSPKYVDFVYYSIKIHKDNETTYINIDPTNNRIIESDENIPILEKGYIVHYDGKSCFVDRNPLTKNMSVYFMEIFDERPNVERKIIPFQKTDDKRARLAKQIMKDYQAAMTAKIDSRIQQELQKEADETEEPEEV